MILSSHFNQYPDPLLETEKNMGLDITPYVCLQPKSEPEPDAYLSGNAAEFAARADGLTDGPYAAARQMHFRAGSYSGYNEWRDQLAKLAGYQAVWHKAPWPVMAARSISTEASFGRK